MEKGKYTVEMVSTCVLAAAIPCVLGVSAVNSRHFESLSREVAALEKKQETLIEDNKRLVTDISVLSSSSRVERIATNELMMHRAESDDIIRVGIAK